MNSLPRKAEAPSEETELEGCCHHEYWMLDMELLGLVVFGPLCFGLIFLLLSFGMAMFTLYHSVCWKYVNLILQFYYSFQRLVVKTLPLI